MFADNIFGDTEDRIYGVLLLTQVAEQLDIWSNADDDAIKYSIEDNFFKNFRIRKQGDTITLSRVGYTFHIEIGDAYHTIENVKIITNGKRFNEAGVQYKINTHHQTAFVISRGEDNKLRIISDNENNYFGNFNLIIEAINEDTKTSNYIIKEGKINFVIDNREDIYCNSHYVYNNIDSISVNASVRNYSSEFYKAEKMTVFAGNFDIEISKTIPNGEKEITNSVVEIISNEKYIIKYKGHTNQYTRNWNRLYNR
jgi:hypothetical protein